jgi:hypothetical protein
MTEQQNTKRYLTYKLELFGKKKKVPKCPESKKYNQFQHKQNIQKSVKKTNKQKLNLATVWNLTI